MVRLASIDLPYANGEIIYDDTEGRVMEAPPIFRWMIGKSIGYVCEWVENKRGTVTDMEKGKTND